MRDRTTVARTARLAGMPSALLALIVAPALLQAQAGEIVGRVTSFETGDPLVGVELSVRGTDARATSSDSGNFVLEDVPPGERTVLLRYLGAGSREVGVEVKPYRTTRVTLVVEMQVIPVAELVVSVDQRIPVNKLTDFYRRMENSPGYFVTRDDIERLQPIRTTALLRRVPGLDVGQRSRSGVTPVTMSRRKGCVPQFYVDGARAPFLDVDAIRPEEIAGIEVYRGNSEVPIRFKHRERCGVIVIWTRDPGNASSFR